MKHDFKYFLTGWQQFFLNRGFHIKSELLASFNIWNASLAESPFPRGKYTQAGTAVPLPSSDEPGKTQSVPPPHLANVTRLGSCFVAVESEFVTLCLYVLPCY